MWPVRRYGQVEGDGIAADRTACGAMGLERRMAKVRGDERNGWTSIQPSPEYSVVDALACDAL
jgi:hypothetical protein